MQAYTCTYRLSLVPVYKGLAYISICRPRHVYTGLHPCRLAYTRVYRPTTVLTAYTRVYRPTSMYIGLPYFFCVYRPEAV
jgi:hypothetical protein